MKRRTFIKSTGIASLSAALPSGKSYADSEVLNGMSTDTVEGRYYYLKRMLFETCTKLGPRPVGSEAFNRGIRLFHKEMKQSLPETFLDEFQLQRWELTGDPVFMVDGQRIETTPFHGSLGTPRVGARGILRKNDSGYPFSIVERTTGEVLANVAISSYGPAIPSNAYRDGEMARTPIFGIGKYDRPLLEKAVSEKSRVYGHYEVKTTNNVPCWNAVGRIPGKTDREILVVAHADTVYTSPGANDNTASAIVMLIMARELAKTPQEFTLTFLASGSEEYGGYLGARNYAKQRIAEGSIENIEYVLQFDSLTYGPDFLLTSQDKGLRDLADSINSELDINGKPRHIDNSGWVMDSLPFETSGARPLFVNSRGYDGVTLPVYHRPEDLPETVAFDCVDNAFRVFSEYVRKVQTL